MTHLSVGMTTLTIDCDKIWKCKEIKKDFKYIITIIFNYVIRVLFMYKMIPVHSADVRPGRLDNDPLVVLLVSKMNNKNDK